MPGGELSQGLPRLRTEGRFILKGDAPFLFRGLNVSGLQYRDPGSTGFLEACGFNESLMDLAIREWGSNVIRLPFTQEWVLRGRGAFTGEEYLGAIDQCIAWAADRRAYTILELHCLDLETPRGSTPDGRVSYLPCLPDEETAGLWRVLASRYGDEPAVLFDLLNEPHEPLPGDRTVPPGLSIEIEWRWQAEDLVRAIRSVAPESVIVAGGHDWAFDLSDFEINAPNILYSTHVYPWKPTDWPRYFGAAAQRRPVIAGEWGGFDTPSDLAFCERLLGYLESNGIGWLAWSIGDRPHILDPATGAPTAFGLVVRSALERNPR